MDEKAVAMAEVMTGTTQEMPSTCSMECGTGEENRNEGREIEAE